MGTEIRRTPISARALGQGDDASTELARLDDPPMQQRPPAAFSSSTSPPVTFVITGPTGASRGASPEAVATSTALTTYPGSPVSRGTEVTLTATITPVTAPGSVQFKDGTTNLGNPVIVSNGTASGTTSTLAAGGHQLTAVFTPADPAVLGPSTSPVLVFEVTDPTLVDVAACARVGQNCPTPRAGTSRLTHFDHLDVDRFWWVPPLTLWRR